MCDYCDCRSHPQVAALSADHDALLALLVSLRRAIEEGDVDRARRALVELHDLLPVHAAREEVGVFRQLREAQVDPAYLEIFEEDHRCLQELLDNTTGPGWRAAARGLAELLVDHIAREESDLFPAAHQFLAPSQWDAVDAAVAEATW